MSVGEIEAVTKRLQQTSVESEAVLSFAKEGLKLDKADDAKKIVQALGEKSSVKTLVLEGNTLGVEAAKVIGKALEGHPEFQNALWSDMFTGRLKSEIPEALQYLGAGIMMAGAHLIELDLSDNAFGPNGMKGLVELLKSESCYSLQVLRLHNNGLGTTGGQMLAECLLECHKRSVAAGRPLALRVFQSGRGRLENEGATALAQAFKAMGSLEEVVMPQNGIYFQGITALAEAFESNKNLRHISLQDNTLTEKGASALAKALQHLENLEIINFGDCLLRTGGAKILASSLKSGHSKLKELNLQYNEINRKGASAIVEAMEDKDNLQSLNLDGNCLGEQGKEIIQNMMEVYGRLEQLGTLSDDEGSEEEDDEEEDDLVEVSDEEPEDETEGTEVNDPQLSVRGTGLTPRQDKNPTVSDFLQFPSPTKLRQLGPDRGRAMVEHLGASVDNIDTSLQAVMKTCSVVTTDDNKTKDEACQCTDAVLSRLYSSGGEENRESAVTNAILVHLGLLKSEDKKFKPISNIKGALIVLEHAVQQKYFPKLAKDVITCFLTRPNPRIDSCVETKHQLLSALHK